jgi:hypothetical protein
VRLEGLGQLKTLVVQGRVNQAHKPVELRIAHLVYCSRMKIEAVYLSETSVNFCLIRRNYVPEENAFEKQMCLSNKLNSLSISENVGEWLKEIHDCILIFMSLFNLSE